MTTFVRLKYFYNPINPTLPYIGDFLIESANYKRGLNENSSFDFSIPVATLKGKTIDFFNYVAAPSQNVSTIRVELYRDGNLVIDGILDSVGVEYVNKNFSYKISCSGEFWELANSPAVPNANYQNEKVLDALNDLLTQAVPWNNGDKWAIGDVSTMQDIMITTTVDLRGEKRLFPQVRKLIESVPNLFFRYAGKNAYTGFREIDIGFFGKQNVEKIYADNILDLSQTIKFSEQVGAIKSYGGEITVAGVPRRIDLNDALTYDPSLAFVYDFEKGLFPIVTSGADGIKVRAIENMPSRQVEIYDEIVPITKVDPSATEIGQAGVALWQKTTADLAQLVNPLDQWQAKVREIPDNFKVGDEVYLDAFARQVYYDNISQQAFSIEIGQVKKWFRCSGVGVSIKNNQTEYSLEVSSNARLEKTNFTVALYETIKQPPQGTAETPSDPPHTFELISASIPVGLESNATVTEDDVIHPALLFDLALPTPPVGAEQMAIYLGFASDDLTQIKFLLQPKITDTVMSFLVSKANDWTIDDSATVYVLLVYDFDALNSPFLIPRIPGLNLQ